MEAHSEETDYGGMEILYPEDFSGSVQVLILKIKLWRDLYTDCTLVRELREMYLSCYNLFLQLLYIQKKK